MAHSLKYQDVTGHTTLTFDHTSDEDVAKVREEFDRLIAQGYMAVEREGGEATQTKAFHPEVEETVMVAPIAGGC